MFGIPESAKKTRYPIRTLRYWIMHHLIRSEYDKRRLPLDICEVGVEVGQMKVFMSTAEQPCTIASAPIEIATWCGVDCNILDSVLLPLGVARRDLLGDAFAFRSGSICSI